MTDKQSPATIPATETATPPAITAQGLNAERTETIRAGAENWARMESTKEAILRSITNALTGEPSYSEFEDARKAAIAGYRTVRPQASDDSANMFWSRLLKAAKEYLSEIGSEMTIPEKPKAATPEAVKKQEQRKAATPTVDLSAATREAVDAAIAESQEKTKAAMGTEGEGTAIAAHKAIVNAAYKRIKAIEAEADKAAKTSRAETRKAIGEKLKDADEYGIRIAELATAIASGRADAWHELLAFCPPDLLIHEGNRAAKAKAAKAKAEAEAVAKAKAEAEAAAKAKAEAEAAAKAKAEAEAEDAALTAAAAANSARITSMLAAMDTAKAEAAAKAKRKPAKV